MHNHLLLLLFSSLLPPPPAPLWAPPGSRPWLGTQPALLSCYLLSPSQAPTLLPTASFSGLPWSVFWGWRERRRPSPQPVAPSPPYIPTSAHYLPGAEIVKRLNGICAQVLPYLSQEHQQQVLGAIERAKQVTAPELNSIIRQQLQAHQLSQLQALALPLTPLPVGLQPPSLPAVSAGTGLLSLSALGSQAHLSKEDKNGHDGDTHQEDDGEKSD
uniref:TLE family member 5, transcriptional modulator n=1 Tax=Macaca fascicularis TaxID=9541 RepID=A0A7N9IBQ7_MACFA